ncbi:hypothetical protein GW17_00023933 [Ensete ventricosum]|nr:hypothetical protein GW17_00023933 [Ensete ventricosum]
MVLRCKTEGVILLSALDLMIPRVWYSSEVNLKVEFDSFPIERARQATSSASAVLRAGVPVLPSASYSTTGERKRKGPTEGAAFGVSGTNGGLCFTLVLVWGEPRRPNPQQSKAEQWPAITKPVATATVTECSGAQGFSSDDDPLEKGVRERPATDRVSPVLFLGGEVSGIDGGKLGADKEIEKRRRLASIVIENPPTKDKENSILGVIDIRRSEDISNAKGHIVKEDVMEGAWITRMNHMLERGLSWCRKLTTAIRMVFYHFNDLSAE